MLKLLCTLSLLIAIFRFDGSSSEMAANKIQASGEEVGLAGGDAEELSDVASDDVYLRHSPKGIDDNAAYRVRRDSSENMNSRDTRSTNPNELPNRPNDMPSGSVYVRWGHTECPEESVLVYDGVAAGSSWGSAGGGVNTLCLPHDPIYDEPTAGTGASRAFLYAAEYQINDFPPRNDREWHDVPCAVCKAPSRFAQLMIPGKNTCPSDGWTLEYGGYLMAERVHSAHKRSTFICVDRSMQRVRATSGAATGGYRHLLDLVESKCVASGGGLECSPYVDGYEMTCAVCTQ